MNICCIKYNIPLYLTYFIMSSTIMEDILETCMVDNGLPMLDNKVFNNIPYNPTQDLTYEPTTGNNVGDMLAELKLLNFNMIHMRTSLDILVSHSRDMSKLMNEKRMIFVPEEIRVPVKFTSVNTEIPYVPLQVPNITMPKKSSSKSYDTKEKHSRKRKHSTSTNSKEDHKISKSMKCPPIGKKKITFTAPTKD